MLELPEHLEMLRDAVRRAAQEEIAPRAAEIDRAGEFDRRVEALLWDLGVLQLLLPPEHGGLPDRRCTALCLCVEEVAKVCASSALLMIIQAVGSFPILHAGCQALLERWAPRLSEGRALAAYLVTEPGAGSVEVEGVPPDPHPARDGVPHPQHPAPGHRAQQLEAGGQPRRRDHEVAVLHDLADEHGR